MTPLREALTIGDVPTAAMWLAHATRPNADACLALAEALADPHTTLPDDERRRLGGRLLSDLEDAGALDDDADGRLARAVLGELVAAPARYGLDEARPAIARIARMLGVEADAASTRRYRARREALADRPAPATPGKRWRLDVGSRVAPGGDEVGVDRARARALVELRVAARELCAVIGAEAECLDDLVEPVPASTPVIASQAFLDAAARAVASLEVALAEVRRHAGRSSARPSRARRR